MRRELCGRKLTSFSTTDERRSLANLFFSQSPATVDGYLLDCTICSCLVARALVLIPSSAFARSQECWYIGHISLLIQQFIGDGTLPRSPARLLLRPPSALARSRERWYCPHHRLFPG